MRVWGWITQEFLDQEDLLAYLQTKWLPLKYQWADCYTRKQLNFGQSVTSQTEASNFNIKSYLVSGKCDWVRLTKSLIEMCENQARNYKQKVAAQQITVKMDYLHQAWLGDLPKAVSHLALDKITQEKRYAQKQLDDLAARRTDELPLCEENCTIWLQFHLPCQHTIAQRLRDNEPLNLQDLDPRWLLDARIDQAERYLRIRDPPPAESRRGRPRNEEVPIVREDVPVSPAASPAVPPAAPPAVPPSPAAPPARGGARVRGRQARGGRASHGGRGRGQGRTPGPARGHVAAGRLSDSIRRTRSQWELEPEVVDAPEQPAEAPEGRRSGRQRHKTTRAIEADEQAVERRKKARK